MAFAPAPVTKDKMAQRRIDQGAASNSVQSLVAALLVFFLIILVGDFYNQYENLAVFFGVLVFSTAFFRIMIVFRFQTLYGAGPGHWRALFALGLLAHALIWGALMAVIIMSYGLGSLFFAAMLYNAGVATGLSSGWMSGLRIRQLCIPLLMLPSIIALLVIGDPESLLVAGLLLLFSSYLFRLYKEQFDIYARALARERRPLPGTGTLKREHAQHRDIQLSLIYRLAHELRTPMNSILGMMSLLDRTLLTHEQREYQQVANQSGQLLLSLIDDVLDYSRILSGRITLAPDFFDLRVVFEQIIDAQGSMAHQKGLELTCVIDRDVPRRVRGDRERLIQVINNLVSNAIKFSEKGEVRIEAKYEFNTTRSGTVEASETGGMLAVKVVDEGPGIDPRIAESLFNDDFHGPDADPFVFRRTGFGLLVCKGLVDAMRGKIGVESIPGKGSTFWFMVHIDSQYDIQDISELCRAMSTKRALIAGAATGTAMAMTEELEILGATVSTAQDYDHALQALRDAHREKCDLDFVFIDVMLRRDLAINLCRTILDDPGIRSVNTVLMVSVEELSLPAVKGLVQHYALPVLTKPLHQAGLRTLLHHVLGIRKNEPDQESLEDSELDLRKRQEYRMLLVEDNEVNQIVTRGMLNKLGYQVKAVGSGEAALELLQNEHFDLVLMDCMMPGLDGFETTRRIRQSEGVGTHVPVIAMTANTVEGAQAKCLAAGMDDFLAKPVHIDQLGGMLRHWLPLTHAGESGPEGTQGEL